MKKLKDKKLDFVVKTREDKTDYKTLDLLHAASFIFVRTKIDKVAIEGNYFEKDRLTISWAMQGMLNNLLRNDLLVIQRLQKKRVKEIEGNFICYNSKTGYSLKEDVLRNLVEQLFHVPERIVNWISVNFSNKKLRIADPFQQQVLFPKAVELIKRKRKINVNYTYKQALKDAFFETEIEFPAFHNALWFNDTEKLLSYAIEDLEQRFKKYTDNLPFDTLKALRRKN